MNSLILRLPAMLAFFFITFCAAAQNPVLRSVFEAQRNLNHFSYRMTSVDTFVNGSTRVLKGRATILVAPADQLGGFYFNAYNEDLNHQSIYQANQLTIIDHVLKSYTRETPHPYPNLIGSAGAQPVDRELFVLDTARAKTIEENELDSCYRITLRFADNEKYNVHHHYRIYYINKKTRLPYRIISHLNIAGRTQSSTRNFYNVTPLAPVVSVLTETDLNLLSTYSQQNTTDVSDFATRLIGKKLDDFTITTFDGSSQKLIEPTGKLTLLDFWEVWCGPCIKAMPKIEALHTDYAGQGLQITGILHEKISAGPARKIIATHNSTIRHVLGTAETEKFFKLQAVPLYVLVDKNKVIRYAQIGFSPQLEAEIKKLLNL